MLTPSDTHAMVVEDWGAWCLKGQVVEFVYVGSEVSRIVTPEGFLWVPNFVLEPLRRTLVASPIFLQEVMHDQGR